MSKRSRNEETQKIHDETVRQLAELYKDHGYEVRADAEGYETPETIYGYRPDIRAKGGEREIVVEVETPDSVDTKRDEKQRNAFNRWMNLKSGREFKPVLTK